MHIAQLQQKGKLSLTGNDAELSNYGWVFWLFSVLHSCNLWWSSGIGCPNRSRILTRITSDATFKISSSASSATLIASLKWQWGNNKNFILFALLKYSMNKKKQSLIVWALTESKYEEAWKPQLGAESCLATSAVLCAQQPFSETHLKLLLWSVKYD